jgi:hypothetical protein
MSAWIVSKAHVDAMVTWALAQSGGYSDQPHVTVWWGAKQERIDCGPWNADTIGQRLVDDIVQGVHHATPTATPARATYPAPYYLQPYVYQRTRPITNAEMVALLNCYSYQACEHQEWEKTWSYAFQQQMQHEILKHVENAGQPTFWGYEDEHVRTAPVSA